MKISIVVPIYNSEDYLRKCVDSLVLQTYKDIEIILVNDGSTDSSYEICKEYKDTDNRIKIVDKQNGGLSDARNAGLDAASGDYIMFVDSDDYIKNTACENFFAILKDKDIDIVAGDAKRIEDNKVIGIAHSSNIAGLKLSGKEFLKIELEKGNMNMAACFNIYKREFLVDNNLLFEKGLLHEDELFTPQAFLKANNVISSSVFFYNYIIRYASITKARDMTKNAQDVIKICQVLQAKYILIEDIKLQALLNDHLVNLYLNSFQKAKLYKNENRHLIKKSLVRSKGYTVVNKIRSILFIISPVLYYFINSIRIKFKVFIE